MMFDIHSSNLGKSSPVSDCYDPTLLFKVPRCENRIHYGIAENQLPFVGFDVWNCYEVSFLTNNGLPVSRILRFQYSANSSHLVESKSLKLYLNSFNFERLGATVDDCEKKVLSIIKKDLENLLETTVQAFFFNWSDKASVPFCGEIYADLLTSIPKDKLEKLEFSHFKESPALLKSIKGKGVCTYAFRSDILRSNCRVTNQPDWGDLFFKIETSHEIDLCSITSYLVSFRKENHFHEEVTEMIYKRFMDKFEPEKLMVATMYTRRGGIDINPIRASHTEWIDDVFLNVKTPLGKTWRQ